VGGDEVNVAYNMDCMEAMREMPDKAFDLAVVDPPYGINASEMQMGKGSKNWAKGKHWDTKTPQKEYFEQLFRVTKECIIFGGNYFDLPKTNAWIVWDKGLYGKVTFGDCEFAWTSMKMQARIAQIRYDGFVGADKDGRFHPTQKPVALYRWIFQRYAKPGYKILDTHLGSGSSRIAAYDAGLDFVGYEIDKEYFDKQEERFAYHAAQLNLFIDGVNL
jgi:site-specific DNA-methyltransferase (adenine-specific)